MLEFLRRRVAPVFALGAVLIIGFLSFSGMYVLWPFLPVAIIAFILSVGYEGEIYLQNIKSAFDKLFLPRYTQELIGKECLHELLQEVEEKKLLQIQMLLALNELKNIEATNPNKPFSFTI